MEVIGETISRYSILREIGSGGMGVVYAAYDPKLGRNVAIKLLNPASDDPMYRMRFDREARAIARLTHPNIATLYDFGETAAGRPFLVMELIDGHTLTDLLLNGELTIAGAVAAVIEVADALSLAHSEGIIHRDIKPSNIMVNEAGAVKVLDFGLAKSVSEVDGQEPSNGASGQFGSKTQTGIVVGTPLYLSPEQAKGRPIDQRSDLFSLGSVLYEALTGRTAFSGQSSLEIGAQVIHIDPVAPSAVNHKISPELDAITLKALAKDPVLRYQKAKEFAGALRKAQVGLSEHPLPIPRKRATLSGQTTMHRLRELTQTITRKRVPVGAIAIGVVLLLAGAFGLQRLLRKGPYVPDPRAKALVERGRVLLRNGEFSRAGRVFDEAIKIDNRYPLAHAGAAEAAVEQDSLNVATSELLTATKLSDGNSQPPLEALYFDALTATITNNNFGDAVKSYQEIARQTPNDAKAHLDLGRSLEKTNQQKDAIEAYQRAIQSDPAYPTPYLRLAYLYTRWHEFGSAKDALDRADALYQGMPDSLEGRALVSERRGLLLREKGESDEARKEFQAALDAAQAQGNTSLEVTALLDLSSIDIRKNRNEAEAKAQKALDLANQHDLKPLAITALIGLYRTQTDRSQQDQADNYLRMAENLAKNYGAKSSEQFVKINIAALRLRQTRPEEALQLALEAKKFFADKRYRSSVAAPLVTILRAQRQLGRYQEALASGKERLDIDTEAGNPLEIGSTYGEIGSVLVAMERWSEALNAYTKMYEYAKANKSDSNMAWAQSNRGEILWRLGDRAGAEAAFAEAEHLASTIKASLGSLAEENRRAEAELALSQKEWAKAKSLVAPILGDKDPQKDELYIRSQIVSGIARANLGSPGEGIAECQAAVDNALPTKNTALILYAKLGLAQARYVGGKMRDAADLAESVAAEATGIGCFETAWRAWRLAANANGQLGDAARSESQRVQSDTALARLQALWDDAAFKGYRTRPDILALN